MPSYRLLSYPLRRDTPLYGDTTPVRISPVKRISGGDTCNTYELALSNHSGTHVDFPNHFFDEGPALAMSAIGDLIFNSVQILDCPKKEDGLVVVDDLKGRIARDCDLLMIKTGFYRFRGQEKYRLRNPGISPEAAAWLRAEHAGIKAIGIDAISITAFQKRDLGRKAHQALLNGGNAVLIIEDVDLSGNHDGLARVFVVPLFVEMVDSMSCTIIGEFTQ